VTRSNTAPAMRTKTAPAMRSSERKRSRFHSTLSQVQHYRSLLVLQFSLPWTAQMI